jgi:hypothetical protein
MSLPDLAAVLWRQRELLEELIYRLESEQLLLAAGRTRHLGRATAEVETILDELKLLEVQRAAVSDLACREIGLPFGATLEELAAAAQPPWTGVLVEHRNALLTSTSELSALAETNRHLMSAGFQAVESALSRIGRHSGPSATGYDARGRTGRPGAGSATVVDRSL